MEIFVKSFEELNTCELYEILKLRVDVFVVEQNCPYPEIDGVDKSSFHIFGKDNGEIAAYARIYKENGEVHLGGVIAKERRKGHATLILKEAIRAAREKYQAQKITIEAQTYAKKLYEKVGFVVDSEEFFLDGIKHIKMVLDLGYQRKEKLPDNIFSESSTKDEVKKLVDKALADENQSELVDKAFIEIWDEISKEN